MNQYITEITSENFEAEVLNADRPVLIDFWATWCGPCRMLAPVIDGIAGEKADTLKVCKVNTDDAPELCAAFGIDAIPTLILMENGKPVRKTQGYMPKDAVLKFIG